MAAERVSESVRHASVGLAASGRFTMSVGRALHPVSVCCFALQGGNAARGSKIPSSDRWILYRGEKTQVGLIEVTMICNFD
jgi:hypothetical protein